ncbi:hypothetical protein [Mycobacterium branderi]|uniref:hypothetical protein n=1 Tax=Mycobacterium branderi TaxID=43348 RepID=UPI00360BB3F6
MKIADSDWGGVDDPVKSNQNSLHGSGVVEVEDAADAGVARLFSVLGTEDCNWDSVDCALVVLELAAAWATAVA